MRADLPVWIALLRAVNVGGSGRLAMANLRALALDLGLVAPRSFGASGNLVFASEQGADALRRNLEAGLARLTGGSPGVVLRGAEQLARLSANLPFPDRPGDRVGILFAPGPFAAPPAEPTGRSDEQIVLHEGEIVIHFPSGMGRSRLKLPQMRTGTIRNRNTLRALVAMAQNSES